MTDAQSSLSERIAALPPEQRLALLARLGQGKAPTADAGIPRRRGEGLAELSFAQQRLWFLQQLEPDSLAASIPMTLSLSGPLLVSALEQALAEIVHRHEALRTRFPSANGGPMQLVEPTLKVPLTRYDISDHPPADRLAEAKRLAREEWKEPFDLAAGPLVRFALIRLEPTEHVLAIVMHHIVSDGWSLGVFNGELSALYAAFATGKPSPLTPLKIQYPDFAEWQRERLQGDVLARQIAFWKERLASTPPLEFPSDFKRPAYQGSNGGLSLGTLDARLTQEVKALCQREGATLAITLLAVFNALLHRYTGQDDIAIGTPIANRNRRELEPLIGFFVNSLVMRTDLSGNPSFRELLARVKAVALAGYDHQDLPFDQVVQELRPERDMSRHPLFQVMFAVQNAPIPDVNMPELRIDMVNWDTKTTRFDIEFHIWDRRDTLQTVLWHNTDLYETATAERLLRHFTTLVQQVVSNPDIRLSQLSLMTPTDRTEVAACASHPTPYPRDATVAELFEAQVARTPEAVAVTGPDGAGALTYSELNRRANQLAHYLRGRGVGPGVVVGLSLGRSPELVVALLGIVKAGGAYLPLDPTYPAERLRHMVAETEPAVVLTAARWESTIVVEPARLVDVEAQAGEFARESAANPSRVGSAESLAYVMYTSGSTGKPKGTCIPQRSIVRLVQGSNFVTWGPTEVVLQYAPMAFDAATFEVWGSLLNGAKLVMAPAGKVGLAELGAFLAAEGVTIAWLTAAVFHQMADQQLPALRVVRQLISGGEVLSVPVVQGVLEGLTPEQRLINAYGPTENTTFTSCHVMTRESVVGATVPIGRPIANTQVYVLDAAGQDVPVGVPGELYAGGDGVALGYWRQPDLTAERFVNDPVRGRLYRTGDRVRYRSDRTVEFLGRSDQQVKVRGYRIELGEIETVLRGHATVRDVAVLVREDKPGDKRIVAYVVAVEATADESTVVSQLRAHIQQLLPEYMVPSAFVLLPNLPVTANGKLDRAALPKPSGRQVGNEFMAPRTPVEEQLAAIWCDVLQLDSVGVHDSFFELGGHSLLATRVISRIRDNLKVDLPLRTIFQAPTIESLALAVVAQGQSATKGPRYVRVSREERRLS